MPIFKKGYGKELEMSDLHKYCKIDEPIEVANALEVSWNDELKKKNPSLVRALFTTFGLRYFCYAMILIVSVSHHLFSNPNINVRDRSVLQKLFSHS